MIIMTNPAAILSVALLIFGVSLMLVVHILVVVWALRRGLISRGTQHANHQDRVDPEDGHGGGLSAGELVMLPCHDFKAADDGGAAGDCAVCLEAFQAGDRCRQLPRCEHVFHVECVDSWLRKRNACPVCRADVVHRSPKGEAKAAASGPGVVEMVEMRSSSPVLEIVTER